MAKVLFTAVVADMRGKIAGTVFSKNKAGAFARTKVSPTNARTAAQTFARLRLANLSASWRGLSQTTRNGWIESAKSAFSTNVFGNTKTLSGQQLFVSAQSNIQLGGYQPFTLSPGIEAPILSGGLKINSTGTVGGEITTLDFVATADTSENVVYLVASTGVISTGISNPSGKFKMLDFKGDPGSTLSLLAAYTALFGTPTVGDNVYFEITAINITTGTAAPKIVVNLLMGGQVIIFDQL